ncbi:hypothetical protein Mbo2_118 [Rhodococcus phage Mbo2]|uniref:Uncharacterized protein n=1 Tax=Rhodococcus phage Mbo2 TaxID=2936911 RepID=A0A9E7IN86_9CAUD|nr:hypothetical protein Mbo2_118 [Rhodococcus phage Mbo2]
MNAREKAVTALAADIAKQMTKRHETLPQETYDRFLRSNLQIAECRAREAVTSIELAGLMIVPAQFSSGEPEQVPALPVATMTHREDGSYEFQFAEENMGHHGQDCDCDFTSRFGMYRHDILGHDRKPTGPERIRAAIERDGGTTPTVQGFA